MESDPIDGAEFQWSLTPLTLTPLIPIDPCFRKRTYFRRIDSWDLRRFFCEFGRGVTGFFMGNVTVETIFRCARPYGFTNCWSTTRRIFTARHGRTRFGHQAPVKEDDGKGG